MKIIKSEVSTTRVTKENCKITHYFQTGFLICPQQSEKTNTCCNKKFILHITFYFKMSCFKIQCVMEPLKVKVVVVVCVCVCVCVCVGGGY